MDVYIVNGSTNNYGVAKAREAGAPVLRKKLEKLNGKLRGKDLPGIGWRWWMA